MLVKIHTTLKKSVLDPQGNAVANALDALGYGNIQDVRVGKYLELNLDISDETEASEQVKQMCEKLLANTVIEDYSFEIIK